MCSVESGAPHCQTKTAFPSHGLTQQVVWETYCHTLAALPDKDPSDHDTTISEEPSNVNFSNAHLKRAVKELHLKCHPDKLVHLGHDFRIYYASLAMTAFLKHASMWFKNPENSHTGVEILEMPLLCITDFETNPSSSCSLPSQFEYVASQQFALAADKPTASEHRTYLANTKQLAEKGRYAEIVFWDQIQKEHKHTNYQQKHKKTTTTTGEPLDLTQIYTTHLSYVPCPNHDHIPDISDTGIYESRRPAEITFNEKIRELVQRLETHDPNLTEIRLEAYDLANAAHFTKLLQAFQRSKCRIRLVLMDGTLMTVENLCALFQLLQDNRTVEILVLESIYSDMVKTHVEALAKMLEHNTTLQELNLSGCGFLTNYSIVHIAQVLPRNATLTRLNLMRCINLYSEGIVEICRALSTNESVSVLEEINLQCTGLTNKATDSLVTLIRQHTPLRSLDVSRNHFPETAIQRLREAQCHSGHLQELRVDPPTIAE